MSGSQSRQGGGQSGEPPPAGATASADPSMEDILASIRRILSEEDPPEEAPVEAPAKAPVEVTRQPPGQTQDVLLLDNSMLVPDAAASGPAHAHAHAESAMNDLGAGEAVPPPAHFPSPGRSPNFTQPPDDDGADTIRMDVSTPAAAASPAAGEPPALAEADPDATVPIAATPDAPVAADSAQSPVAAEDAAPMPLVFSTTPWSALAASTVLVPVPGPGPGAPTPRIRRPAVDNAAMIATPRPSVPFTPAQTRPEPMAATPQSESAPMSSSQSSFSSSPPASHGGGLASPETTNAAAGSVANLVRALTSDRGAQVFSAGPTVADLVREELRPMLKAWLDSNLPPLVERLVRAEIERVIARASD
jgi:cell pole-organizing protein PopZ